MKERPILFSAPMVRAILAGTKTQTRRICKPQPEPAERFNGETRLRFRAGKYGWHTDDSRPPAAMLAHCPYGQPGDRLWVRESWNARGLAFGMKPSQAARIASPDAWRYAADDATGWQHGWKPSIHMPRAASRITLAITGVRVERLQEISEDDAKAEGVERNAHEDGSWRPEDGWIDYLDLAKGGDGFPAQSAGESYCTLWESINGPGSWAANPWVWVVEFKKVAP